MLQFKQNKKYMFHFNWKNFYTINKNVYTINRNYSTFFSLFFLSFFWWYYYHIIDKCSKYKNIIFFTQKKPISLAAGNTYPMKLTQYTNKPDAQAAGADPSRCSSPVGKIHPLSKIAVTFEPIQQFWCPSSFRIYETNVYIVCFKTGCTIINRLGMMAP